RRKRRRKRPSNLSNAEVAIDKSILICLYIARPLGTPFSFFILPRIGTRTTRSHPRGSPSSGTGPGHGDDEVPDPSSRRQPPPYGQGRTGGDRLGVRLAAGHDPGDGEAERPHDRPASRPGGLSPGELVAGEIDHPRRPIVVGPSPQRIDESDRVVEVRLR